MSQLSYMLNRVDKLNDEITRLQQINTHYRLYLTSIATSECIPTDKDAWQFCVDEAKNGLKLP